MASLGLLAERTADTRRWLRDLKDFAQLPIGDNSWADRVFYHVASSFLRNIRQQGWAELDIVAKDVQALRDAQAEYEDTYLKEFGDEAPRAAVELVAMYHWAKAAELVSQFLAQGTPTDMESQIQFHFGRAEEAAAAGWIGELGTLLFLTERVTFNMITRSVWRTLRPLGDKFVQFVQQVVQRAEPIFELLPPQKCVLENRLMDIAQRAVVIQMPMSSGKTLLAEFRILQTKQTFADAMRSISFLLAPL